MRFATALSDGLLCCGYLDGSAAVISTLENSLPSCCSTEYKRDSFRLAGNRNLAFFMQFDTNILCPRWSARSPRWSARSRWSPLRWSPLKHSVAPLVPRFPRWSHPAGLMNVEMRKDPLFAMLADDFAFYAVVEAFCIQARLNRFGRGRKDMNINVGAVSNMPGESAADDLWAKSTQKPHDSQRFDPHFPQTVEARTAFEQIRHPLNLIPDFGVCRQFGRLHPALAQSLRRLQLRPIIFSLIPRIHQPRRFNNDGPPQSFICHASCVGIELPASEFATKLNSTTLAEIPSPAFADTWGLES